MGWRKVAAGLGTGATVKALKAAEGQVSKRKYKRLIATAVAELLALHPDLDRAKARRRARRMTGARPSKKLMRASRNLGWKEGAEGVVAAAATAGIAKVAGVVGEKLRTSSAPPRRPRTPRLPLSGPPGTPHRRRPIVIRTGKTPSRVVDECSAGTTCVRRSCLSSAHVFRPGGGWPQGGRSR